jgi:branched-chain amino acid aminotransferase
MKAIIQLARTNVLAFIARPRGALLWTRVANAPSQRTYSQQSLPSRSDGLPGVDLSKLSIVKTTKPKDLPPPQELVFGSTFTGESYSLEAL